MTSSTPRNLRLPRGKAYDPYEHADALGLQVIFRTIRTANELWMPEYRTIVIKSGMRAVHQRNALAHGIGHADLGHEDACDRQLDRRHREDRGRARGHSTIARRVSGLGSVNISPICSIA